MTTFTVNTTADIDDGNFSQLSLREAVNLANATTDADVIVFASAIQSQKLVLTGGELVLSNDVTIHGGGVTIDGNGFNGYDGHRILNIVGAGTDVSLDNLILTDGRAAQDEGIYSGGGAILVGGGSLTMTGCTIRNSSGGDFSQGGGIFAASGSHISIATSAIYDNSAGQSYNDHRFTLGGGIAGGENVALTIRDSQISGNLGSDGGGAIWLYAGSSLVMERTIARDNYAYADGSAGGAIGLENCTATISQSTISANSAAVGGGLWSVNSHVTLIDSTVAGNDTNDNEYGWGGGISARGGALIVRNSTITANYAYAHGGGIYLDASAQLDIANSIVAGNVGLDGYGNPAAPDISGAITFSNGHNIFGSDVGANPAGDRENIAASAIFAAIDPDTGGGLLNAIGVVPLRNNLDNPALSGADLAGGGCHRPARHGTGPSRPAACPTSARSRSAIRSRPWPQPTTTADRHRRRQRALGSGRQRLPQGPRRQGHAQRRGEQRSPRRRDGQRHAQRRQRHRFRAVRRQHGGGGRPQPRHRHGQARQRDRQADQHRGGHRLQRGRHFQGRRQRQLVPGRARQGYGHRRQRPRPLRLQRRGRERRRARPLAT